MSEFEYLKSIGDRQWLAEQFEFEGCFTCGHDEDAHLVAIDPLGNPHAWCRDVDGEEREIY